MSEEWFVFPLEINTGADGYGPPFSEWDGEYWVADDVRKARRQAVSMLTYRDCDYVAIFQFVDGHGLRMFGSFGFRPAKYDSDLVGTSVNALELIGKFTDKIIADDKVTLHKVGM